MSSKDDRSDQAAELHRRIERITREKAGKSPKNLAALSLNEAQQMLHDLQVYQIELEMQNEELRRTQEKLEAVQERYFDLFDLAPVGYCTLSEQGLIMETNLTAANLLGMVRDTLVKQPVSRFILKEDQENYFLHHKRLFETDEPQECELRLTKRDGTFFWANLAATAMQGADGVPMCRVVIFDITERKQVEVAFHEASKRLEIEVAERTVHLSKAISSLREKEHYLQSIIETSPECIKLLGRDGSLLMMNCAGLNMIDADSLEQVQGKVINDLVLDAYRDQFKELAEKAFRGESGTLEFELKGLKGRHLWVETHTVPYRNEKDEIIALLGITRDITERKQAEESIRSSEARYHMLYQKFEALFNGIPDSLTLLSPDLTVLWVNKEAARFLNMEQAAMIDRHCYEVRHGFKAPCENCPVQASLVTGKMEKLNFLIPDGRVVELRAVPVLDEFGKVIEVIEVGRDITEQKNLEQQLQQSQKMEAVGQLAGGIAHDFNNILTAIIGYTSLLQMKMDEDNPLQHYGEQILSSAEKAAILTQSLLAFSRKQQINPQPVDLNAVLTQGHKLLQRLIREDIEFVMDLCPEPIIVMADSIQLEQVFMNLVANARDAMPDGGALVMKTEKFSMDDGFTRAHGYGKPGTYACLSVTDTGIGMDEKTRGKIFEPFFTTKETGKGTGLGLAMVYGMIKQHEGYIDVYSEPGLGTTFKLYLPLISRVLQDSSVTKSPIPKGNGEVVLLAEDNESVRKSNREILEVFGYTIIEAIDGDDAIEKFARHKDQIDLLMLDVIMPRKSGREVLEIVRKIKPDVKVLFTSGYTDDIIIRKGILDDKLHFISKPVLPQKLLAKISETLSDC